MRRSPCAPRRSPTPSRRRHCLEGALCLALLVIGCGNGEEPSPSGNVLPAPDASFSGTTGGNVLVGAAGDAAIGAGAADAQTGAPTAPSPSGGGATTGAAGGTRGGLFGGTGTLAGAGTGGAAPGGSGAPDAGAGTGGPVGPTTPAGPDDGDPSQPVVAIPNLKCGPNPSLAGLTTTNVMIGGRAVHVAYPCNKHKGAPVTFILNLHGTMPVEELKLYQVAYFAANNYVTSHNLITAAPIAIGSQWGNGDGGADEPHLKAVIEWVYTTFKDFDIRAMWIGGHSWGAMYTTTYVCRPEFMDKVRGTILMSTMPTMPACSSRISVINTNAENDIAAPLPQGNIPMQHGCGAAEKKMLGNNEQTLWPNCQKGYVHSNYLMLGKAHADYMDDVVVKSIVDLIKAARP